MKVDADLEVDSGWFCSPRPLAGVFNASDNLNKLHRLENRPKSRQFLVKFGWVNVHLVPLKPRSPEKLMDVSVFTKMIDSLSRCMTIKTRNTFVMERIRIGKLCFSFHPGTCAHDAHEIAD